KNISLKIGWFGAVAKRLQRREVEVTGTNDLSSHTNAAQPARRDCGKAEIATSTLVNLVDQAVTDVVSCRNILGGSTPSLNVSSIDPKIDKPRNLDLRSA